MGRVWSLAENVPQRPQMGRLECCVKGTDSFLFILSCYISCSVKKITLENIQHLMEAQGGLID